NHKMVGYTLTKRNRFYVVRFIAPSGTYMRVSTGVRDCATARLTAREIISQAHFQTGVRLTWDEMIERLKTVMLTNGNRPATYEDYVATIEAIRTELPQTT